MPTIGKSEISILLICTERLVEPDQGILTVKNEWVQYSTPFEGGAEYFAVCLPAFAPDIVNRDA